MTKSIPALYHAKTRLPLTVDRKIFDENLDRHRWREETLWYDVEIDIDLALVLKELGEKAAKNKSRRTRALSGNVRVKVKELRGGVF